MIECDIPTRKIIPRRRRLIQQIACIFVL